MRSAKWPARPPEAPTVLTTAAAPQSAKRAATETVKTTNTSVTVLFGEALPTYPNRR